MKKRIILYSVCIGLFAACGDLLQETLVSDVADTYYETPEGFERGVNSSYHWSRQFYGDRVGTIVAVFGTDTWTAGDDGGLRFFDSYESQLDELTGGFPAVTWENHYKAINNINLVLSYADGVEMGTERKERLTGELHFLRAFYYYKLVRMFGDVPVHTTPTDRPRTEESRDPQSEVYAQIVTDLRNALELLPPGPANETGRATEYAVKHLLSEVLLTRGYTDFAESNDFLEAKNIAEEVIDSGFELMDRYGDVFKTENSNSSEIIWAIQYSSSEQFNNFPNRADFMFNPKYDNLAGMDRTVHNVATWMRHQPTGYLLDLYVDEIEYSTRYEDTFQSVWYADYETTREINGVDYPIALGDTAIWVVPPHNLNRYDPSDWGKGYRVVHPHGDIDDRLDGYYNPERRMYPTMIKHRDYDRPAPNDASTGKDHVIYRLAMTHLIAAEAHHNLGNNIDAANHINVVRRRAAKPGQEFQMEVSADDIDLDFIMDEWGIETAGEIRRWFDIKRPGVDFFLKRIRDHNTRANPNVQAHHYYRPIPEDQIIRVTTPFPQNCGYVGADC